jgi:hypothetical protein
MSYKYNPILTSDISQNGGFGIWDFFKLVMVLVVVFGLLLCCSSSLNWPVDLDTEFDGALKDIKMANWGGKLLGQIKDKLDPTKWR